MAKDPTPRADGLQAMREARYGHLQATAEPAKMGRPTESKPVRKLIPYAGKDTKGIAPKGSVQPPRNKRKRNKLERKTEL